MLRRLGKYTHAEKERSMKAAESAKKKWMTEVSRTRSPHAFDRARSVCATRVRHGERARPSEKSSLKSRMPTRWLEESSRGSDGWQKAEGDAPRLGAIGALEALEVRSRTVWKKWTQQARGRDEGACV
eukprot:4238046-Pleurochrysis_carterae.AAC.4